MEDSNFDLDEAIAIAKRAQPKGCDFSGPSRVLTAYFSCPDLVLECSEEIGRLHQKNEELKCVTDSTKEEIKDLLLRLGGVDGEHHKQWIIDQVLRMVTGEKYEAIITQWNHGEDGEDTYQWNNGIAP